MATLGAFRLVQALDMEPFRWEMDSAGMIHFKLAPHTARAGDVIEVWDDAKFIAAIYPGKGNTFRIFTKYETAVVRDGNSITIAIDSRFT